MLARAGVILSARPAARLVVEAMLPRTVPAMDRPDVATIPAEPGCYQFHAADGRVLYVGKAKDLRSRLSSYFGANLHPRTAAMVREADRVEWLTVPSETDALLVEASLIRSHQPPYNVRLRHDHDAYPYLAITSEEVPRIITYRGPSRPGLARFGPYPGPGAARKVLDVAIRAWGVRSCTQRTYEQAKASKRPCLLGEIGRCSAPCVSRVSAQDYAQSVEATKALLSGDVEPTRARLREQMAVASADRRYELAAALRDRLAALDDLVASRTLTAASGLTVDAVALSGDELGWAAQALCLRSGMVVGSPTVLVDRALHQVTAQADLAVVTAVVLADLYLSGDHVPPAVIALNVMPEDHVTLEAALSQRRGAPVRLVVPVSGARRDVLTTAEVNATGVLRRARLRRSADADSRRAELASLAVALGLPSAPLRIECYDISHHGGVGTVAAMSVLEEGLPRPALYRRWHLKERNDDFASMREVLHRRLSRMLAEADKPASARDRGFAAQPSLILIDGGPQQLAVAVAVCEELGVTVPLASLAKRLEEVFLPHRAAPVRLDLHDPALYVLQRARDEAHRTAISYGRRLRRPAVTSSALDDVAGLGPKRRRRLLDELGGDISTLTAQRLVTLGWLPERTRFALAEALGLDVPSASHPAPGEDKVS